MSQLDSLVDLSASQPMSDSASNMDEFDPFGPSSNIEAKDNGNLLVDFTVETQEKPKENGISNNFDAEYEVTADVNMSAEKQIQEEGHIYANSEPIAHPVYENITVNGKADDDTYENVIKETGDDQEISVTLKTDDGAHLYDTLPVHQKENENNNDEDDVMVVTDEIEEMVVHDDISENITVDGDAAVSANITLVEEDTTIEAEVEILIPQSKEEDQAKSPSRSRSNSQRSASPAERPASPTPASEDERKERNVSRSPSPTMSDEEAAAAVAAATSINVEEEEEVTRRGSQGSMHSPVPTPTPRKRTSLSRSKSPDLEVTKEHSRSPSPKDPSISSEGRNTRSPSPDDMIIHQEEEVIRNGETVSLSKENATFSETRCDPNFNAVDDHSTDSVSSDKIHSPVVGDENVGYRVMVGRTEAGTFENVPVILDGVVRHSEPGEEDKLPEHGTARNLAAKFKELEDESVKPIVSGKRDITPDRFQEKSEFISEPRDSIISYEGKSDAGIFESQPAQLSDHITSGYAKPKDQLPEKGSTLNMLEKFKDIQKREAEVKTSGKIELTPDGESKSEFVSEPRATFEPYCGKTESGIFESSPVYDPNVIRPEEVDDEDILPDQGTARNLVAKFRKLQQEQPYTPKTPTDLIPSKEVGPAVVESQPVILEGVAKEGDEIEEKLPERGQTRNLLVKFREIESGGSQSPSPRSRKEFTPPREHPRGINANAAESGIYENTPTKGLEYQAVKIEGGIFENQPVSRQDVYKEGDIQGEILPEHGSARNLLSKFKKIQSDTSNNSATPRSLKEFTPPRDDLPTKSSTVVDYGSGTAENEPQYRPDVSREADTDWSEGLPTKGTAKSVADKFRCIQEEAKKESAKAMPKKLN